MLEIVTIELVLAPASMLMLGANAAGYTGDLAVATSGPSFDEVGRTRSALVAFRTAATADEGLNNPSSTIIHTPPRDPQAFSATCTRSTPPP